MYGILCIGDCFVTGRGEIPSIGWTGRLKTEHETEMYRNVHLLGIPGDTIEGLLFRFEPEAKSRCRYLREKDEFKIVFQIGINDSKGLGSPKKCMDLKKFEKKLTKLIKVASKYVKPYEISIIGIPPVDEKYTTPYEGTYMYNERNVEYNNGMKQISERMGVNYIDIFSGLYNKEYIGNLVDGLHPNSKGYTMMYNIIRQKLFETKNLK
jgi:lysophospholipase L1-like esterase